MKKIAVLFTAFMLFLNVHSNYGQDTLKASNRNFLTELNVNLFQGQLTLNNAINQIKFRYMISNLSAVRLGFTVNSRRVINNAESVYGTNPYKDDEKQTTTMVGINLGFERHFAGTRRLSPYIGGEISFAYKWSKDVIDNISSTTTIDGAWQQTQVVQTTNGSYYITSNNSERGYLSYGLNIVTGFDFYMAKNLFIGYEMQFGFTNKDYSNIDITTTGTTSTSTPTNYDNKEFFVGPNIINGIRIGYVF